MTMLNRAVPVAADFDFRAMAEDDIAAVRELHARSFVGLAQAAHTAAQIAGHVALIEDEAYADELRRCHIGLALDGERIVATAGWLEMADQIATARIRKVFVDPALARRGLGSRMVRRAEADALRSGYRRLVVRANLNAVPLYEQLGYVASGQALMAVPGGVTLPVVMMEKPLD
jgi:GNAT superfamily N-acetyltransferase